MTWRRALLLFAPAVLFSLAWIPVADPPPSAEPLPYVADAVTGWILIVAGLVASARRPLARTGPLLVLAGYLWYVGDLYIVSAGVPLVSLLSFAFRGYYDLPLSFLLMSFPGVRLGSRPRRVLVAGLAAVLLLRSVAFLVTARPGAAYPGPRGSNPFLLLDHPATARWLDVHLALASGIVLALIGIVAIRRWWTVSQATRRVLAPVLAGGVIWVATSAFINLDRWVDLVTHAPLLDREGVVWWPLFDYVLRGAAAPVGFLVGALMLRMARSAVVDLVSGIDDHPARHQLQPALVRVLGDPSLTVLYPTDPGGWADGDGRPGIMPPPDGVWALTSIDSGGRTIAMIIHDPALLEDPGLVSAVAATVRLAVDNERLNAALEDRVREVTASRQRIVEAGDAERRRIERDLHDGAQQRLVALAISLRMLGESLSATASQETVDELEAASSEVRATIDELRELASGLDPSILRHGGLARAIESLAERSSTSVRLDLSIDGRCKASETTAYFLVAEALANVAKHASASVATVRARLVDGRLSIQIDDDGEGGADPARGSGLRGLSDRVAAIGGRLELSTPPGGGTRLVADLPCE